MHLSFNMKSFHYFHIHHAFKYIIYGSSDSENFNFYFISDKIKILINKQRIEQGLKWQESIMVYLLLFFTHHQYIQSRE